MSQIEYNFKWRILLQFQDNLKNNYYNKWIFTVFNKNLRLYTPKLSVYVLHNIMSTCISF